jgi:DNA-binding transcriptional MerR regulator
MEIEELEIFWESGDAARRLEVVPQTVHDLVDKGKLSVAATTPRGTRLFRPSAVERLATERAKKAEAARG